MKKEVIQEAVKLYLKLQNASECARILGIKGTTLYYQLKKMGVLSTNRVPEDIQAKIVDYYVNKRLRSTEIAPMFNICSNTVIKIVERAGFQPRNHSSKYYWNQDYFEKIDSKDKAYFLGLMVADGHNVSGRPGLSIQLEEGDRAILEKFKECIEYTGELYLCKAYEIGTLHYRLLITCPMLSKGLSSHGVTPRKTHTSYFPDIEEQYWSHFIRGVFDGDGCISIKSNGSGTFSIIGNKVLIETIQEVLIENCDLKKGKLYHCNNTKDNIVSFGYSRRTDLLVIKDYLYKDCEDLFLTRKKEKFDKIEIL